MQPLIRGLTTLATVVLLTVAGVAFDVDTTSMAFVYHVAVVFLSIWAGLRAGITASLLASGFYNYFFLPPLHTFHIDDPRNWTALAVFLISAIIVTRIVLAGREQAAEAERRRVEGEAGAHLELMRQSDAFKTSLLRAVSHDLTTPLTAMRIHAASLRRQSAALPALAITIDALEEEAARLHRRIDNLLTIARLESGRFDPHPEPTPAADLFRSVRESLLPLFASRPVEISVSAQCPDAYVDPSLALEILVNLMENAHRAAPERSPIELAAEGAGDAVRLEVRDRGPGVAPDSDVARRGLGLEIARGLATASNGSLELLVREGGGSIARLELPAAAIVAEGSES